MGLDWTRSIQWLRDLISYQSINSSLERQATQPFPSSPYMVVGVSLLVLCFPAITAVGVASPVAVCTRTQQLTQQLSDRDLLKGCAAQRAQGRCSVWLWCPQPIRAVYAAHRYGLIISGMAAHVDIVRQCLSLLYSNFGSLLGACHVSPGRLKAVRDIIITGPLTTSSEGGANRRASEFPPSGNCEKRPGHIGWPNRHGCTLE